MSFSSLIVEYRTTFTDLFSSFVYLCFFEVNLALHCPFLVAGCRFLLPLRCDHFAVPLLPLSSSRFLSLCIFTLYVFLFLIVIRLRNPFSSPHPPFSTRHFVLPFSLFFITLSSLFPFSILYFFSVCTSFRFLCPYVFAFSINFVFFFNVFQSRVAAIFTLQHHLQFLCSLFIITIYQHYHFHHPTPVFFGEGVDYLSSDPFFFFNSSVLPFSFPFLCFFHLFSFS